MALLRNQYVRVALVWLVLTAILFGRSWQSIGEHRFPDPDDILRLVQVRDLLGGQGWFDLHQYRIDGPSGTLMHWSRLVDLPLAFMIMALTPLMGSAGAEQVAIIAVPLLTLAAVLLAVAKVASRYLDIHGVTLACLCVGLSSLLMAQLQPMRIDHHGWQVFTVMLAMVGLVPGPGWRGPALAGLALAAGLSISLEVMPITAAFGAVFAIRWLLDSKERGALVGFLVSLAISLTVLFVATRGIGDLVEHCDVVAPALLCAFAVMAGGASAVAWLNPKSRPVLVALLGVPVIAGAALYLVSAPACAAGPFGSLDPLVREFWYNNILEGRPAWMLPVGYWVPLVIHAVIALGSLAALARQSSGAERQWWLEYLLIAAASLLAGLIVWRSLAFTGAICAVPLGWLLGRMLKAFSAAPNTLRKLGIAVIMLFVLVPSLALTAANAIVPDAAATVAKVGSAESKACRLVDSAQALNAVPAGKIFAPMDLGPAVLELTGHSVTATSHHRANLAMHDVIAAFLAAPDEALPLVRKHGAQYVLVCSTLVEAELYRKKAPQGLAAQLIEGNPPAWLERVPLAGPAEVQLWKVKAATAS